MKKVLSWIKHNPHRSMFLVPIVLVAIISISHVVTWYDMANPMMWAMYLSIAIEIAAMTALVAVNNQSKAGVWFMFGIVTFIQIIGNIFFCFKEIDSDGELFKSWVELTLPIWEIMGTDVSDTIGLKRWLALLEGGLLPIISLTSLHFFVNYKLKPDEKEKVEDYFEKRNQLIVEKVEENKKKSESVKSEEELYPEPTQPVEKITLPVEPDTLPVDKPGVIEREEKKEKPKAVDLNSLPEDEPDVDEGDSNIEDEEDETEYLLKSEKNNEHLEESITQVEEIETITETLEGTIEEKRKFLIDQLKKSDNPTAMLDFMEAKIKEKKQPKETPIISPKSGGKTNIERID